MFMSTCRRQIADSQQWRGMKDAILHLQLPIVYLIWGLLRHCWTLRRRLEAAADCWRSPQYDGKCSFYFTCYFFRTTPTNQDLREKAVYFPPRFPKFKWISMVFQMNAISMKLNFTSILVGILHLGWLTMVTIFFCFFCRRWFLLLTSSELAGLINLTFSL